MKHEISEAAASVAKVAAIPTVGLTMYGVTLQDVVLVLTAVSLVIQIVFQVVKIVRFDKTGKRE